MNTQENNNPKFHDTNESDFSLFDILFILKKHKFKIVLATTIIFVITFLYTFWVKPVYRATGSILIEDSSSSMDIFDIGGGQSKIYLDNEIAILKSRTTAEKTVKVLFSSEKKNDLFLFGTKKYVPNGIHKIIRNLLTFGLVDKIESNQILSNEINQKQLIDFSTKLKRKIKIANTNNTDVLRITVESIDPDEASLLVNTVVDVYKAMDLEWANDEMSHLKSFLENQLSKKEKELSFTEEKLNTFQKTERVFGVDGNSRFLFNTLMNTESELYRTIAEQNILKERISYIKSQLTDEEKKLTNGLLNTIEQRLFALKSEIDSKEAELISSIIHYGENHDAVIILKEKLNLLRKKLTKDTQMLILQDISVADPLNYRQALMDSVISITALTATFNSKINEYKKLVSNYENKLSELPEKELEYTRLERNSNIHAETYSLMRQKLEEARINEASQTGKVRIIDKAHPVNNPIKPNKKFNLLIGLILGLGFGVSLSFVIEFFNNTIMSIDDIVRRNLSILALIPSITIDENKQKTQKYIALNGKASNIQRRLITHENPKSPVSEAYRGLRTSLVYSDSHNEDCSVILISSPGPGEGKTTTIVNLAIAYANLGEKTLLIDCDLRKPVTHNIFSIDKDPGITRFLAGKEDDISKLISNSEVNGLDVITCGAIPPNPSEILASKRMKNAIKLLKSKYDIILIDSPPLLAVTDSYILTKLVNQFILVIRMGKTEKGGLDRAIDQFSHFNVELSGIVINDVDESNSYGKGYYYNYYQYYNNDEA